MGESEVGGEGGRGRQGKRRTRREEENGRRQRI